MLEKIKKIIPTSIKSLLRLLKIKMLDNPRKRKLAQHMQQKHQQLLSNIKGKKKIKIVFLVIHKSVWKVDSVFRKMLEDPYFEPEILVCPYTVYGEERMLEDMDQAFTFFKEKGYSVVKSLNNDGTWVGLNEIKPDIVFFTNPHNLTRKEYYEDAYLNYLSCYVPYSHDVSKYDGYISQYNQYFHNAVWMIFVPHTVDLFIFKKYSQRKNYNIFPTGYTGCEELLIEGSKEVWKKQHVNRLKIIWAPHHTIDDKNLPYSNFLSNAWFFKKIAEKYKEKIHIAFKPHPILKSKLYLHDDWGINKTDMYYKLWEEMENTQLELGDYADLFKTSDAMIHDSGSFLAEYHYVKKPVFYICDESVRHFLNPFGVKALESCYRGGVERVEEFIKCLIENKAHVEEEFFNQEVKPYFETSFPSEKVISSLKEILKNRQEK